MSWTTPDSRLGEVTTHSEKAMALHVQWEWLLCIFSGHRTVSNPALHLQGQAWLPRQAERELGAYCLASRESFETPQSRHLDRKCRQGLTVYRSRTLARGRPSRTAGRGHPSIHPRIINIHPCLHSPVHLFIHLFVPQSIYSANFRLLVSPS